MRIPIDRAGRVPLYRQVADWLRHAIVSGALAPGTRLPATRALAEKLAVSRITIVTAYATLEAAGLVVTGEGSGTFVATRGAATGATALPRVDGGPADEKETWPLWQQRLAPVPVPADGVGDLLAPDGISVSFTGVGDTRLFPTDELARTVKEVLREDGAAALEYGPIDAGLEPLRRTVAQILTSQGMQTHADHVVITSGSQQALALTCQVLLGPADAVVVEQPTYNLALDLFRALGLTVVGVPADASGMRVDLLEPVLQQHHPRLVYTIPNFQNPSGASLSLPRRRELLAVTARYNIPVVEDDFVGDLRFDGRALPAVKALDRNGQVIYLGTFAKMLAPGLRVGYLVAHGPVLDRLVLHKRAHDLTTSPLLQRVLDRYVTVGRYQAHLRRTTRHYRRRRDALLEAVQAQLPQVRLHPPRGGLFAWLALPDGVSSRALLAVAHRHGVTFAPGAWFFIHPDAGDRFLRLNYAVLTPEEIRLGVRRLRSALRELDTGD